MNKDQAVREWTIADEKRAKAEAERDALAARLAQAEERYAVVRHAYGVEAQARGQAERIGEHLETQMREAEARLAQAERERDDAQDGYHLHVVRAEAAEAALRATREALREAADKFSVLSRCAINSRTAPNVFDTVYDVATWARDAALAAAERREV